jgi:hypothetical protein
MLYATGKLTRRLYRPGDTFHPGREGGKQVPAREEIPEPYHRLLDWYFEDYAGARDAAEKHSLLVLRGMGKEMWAGVDPDEFVRRLREGWK